MANEPERLIEKVLRAAAKQRRDEAGAPFELHVVNRRLLQGEVARTFAQSKRGVDSFFRMLGQLWPRFAWGVAILAVLVVAARLLFPLLGKADSQALMAKNQPVSRAVPAKESLSPAATDAAMPTPAASPVAKRESAAASTVNVSRPVPAAAPRQFSLDQKAIAQDGPAAPSQPKAGEGIPLAAASQLADLKEPERKLLAASGGPSARTTSEIAYGTRAAPSAFAAKPAPAAARPALPVAPTGVAVTPPAATVMAATESPRVVSDKLDMRANQRNSMGTVASAGRIDQSRVAVDGLSKSAVDAMRDAKALRVAQRFVQVAPEAKQKSQLAGNSTAAQPVLAAFQLEQTGQELRIVDADGSVYSGFLQTTEAPRRTRSTQVEAPAASPSSRAVKGMLEEKAAPSLVPGRPAPLTYSFRVTGTNRSLNKSVVFTGNLLTITNLALALPMTTNWGVEGALGGGGRGDVLSKVATNSSIGSNLGAYRYASDPPVLVPLLNSKSSRWQR
ncbi:MAG: hypothetical protein NT154_13830 [Verrucomicrobia bacterium]|nr:hypothetical protein [Verrucomicrobiota bacterium]